MRALGLVLLLLVMPASAQTLVAEDGEGDQTMTLVAVDDPRDWPMLDLRALTIAEKAEAFVFRLAVADLDLQAHETANFFGGGTYFIYFSFQDADYRLQVFRLTPIDGSDPIFRGSLQVHDAGFGDYLTVRSIEATGDLGEDTITGIVPRNLIVGDDGSTPTRGLVIKDFWAESSIDGDLDFMGAGIPPVQQGGDRLPDEGVAAFVWDVVYGLEQTGHAWLSSDLPYRVSNGEATTFLYEVTAMNKGDADDRFRFEAKDGPQDWVVTFPEEQVDIDGGEDLLVPILVTVPFNHQHGTSKSIVIEMHSQTDPTSVGRIELGVLYTEVPQPAGHHDRMFLHSSPQASFRIMDVGVDAFDSDFLYFNTLEDDDNDSGEALTTTFVDCDIGTRDSIFRISLNPGLAMGLDFDTGREGSLEITLETPLPANQVVVRGELHRHVGPESFFFFPGQESDDEETLLATLPATDPIDMGPGDTQTFTLPIIPTDFADYVPYEHGARLQLDLYVREDRPSLFFCLNDNLQTPFIHAGGTFTLPLDEYHDDVDDYFQALSSVDLLADGSQKRFVNPGATALFNITAAHTGNEGGTYRLELTGSNVEWATVVGKQTFKIEPGQSKDLFVAVTAPADAQDGMLADITLHAVKEDDANVRTVIRMLTEVDVDEVHEDATEQVQVLGTEDDKKSPGPFAAVIVLLALLARRRP